MNMIKVGIWQGINNYILNLSNMISDYSTLWPEEFDLRKYYLLVTLVSILNISLEETEIPGSLV